MFLFCFERYLAATRLGSASNQVRGEDRRQVIGRGSVAEALTPSAFAYSLSDPRSAMLSAVRVIQQPCTLCCSNRLLKNALAFSKVACFGARGGRHATLEARCDVDAVAEQILALNHDVAETPIRNMTRRQGGISA